MYDTGRYHSYIKRHAACPSLSPGHLGSIQDHSQVGGQERDEAFQDPEEDSNEMGYEEAAEESRHSRQQQTNKGDRGARGSLVSTAASVTHKMDQSDTHQASAEGKSSASSLVLFKDAHRVHPKPQRPGTASSSQGTSAFKVKG